MTSIFEGQPPQKKGHLGSSLQSQFFRLKSSLGMCSSTSICSSLYIMASQYSLDPPASFGKGQASLHHETPKLKCS